MRIDYSVGFLHSESDWSLLSRELGDGHSKVVKNTIRHLRILGVTSYISEEPYIDRDYSTDFLHFYARTFRAHRKYCKRVHFFSQDVPAELSQTRSTSALNQFQEIANTAYCGFCVVRPLSTGSIGRTILRASMRGHSDIETNVTCRAEFNANLFGVDLKITGTSYLQQDARVGACAQIAIWVGMRHMHARHGYNWVSVADITEMASPITPEEGVSLPAGSEFLASERMLKAIVEAGYQPLCFQRDIPTAILPYVESGIPVILGLNIEGEIGHAVTVIGRVFQKQDSTSNQAIDYVPSYIIHDDQGGPYMCLPRLDSSDLHPFHCDTIKYQTADGEVVLNGSQAVFAVALMSPRVFSTAAEVEVSVRDRVNEVLRNLSQSRSMLGELNLPVNDRLLDELQEAHAHERLVLRTYLTSAAGYRRHIADGTAGDDLKSALLELHLPHFTWVTEITTVSSYNNSSPGMRRIYGHTVMDATSTGKVNDGLLLLHLPGMLFTRDLRTPGKDEEKFRIVLGDDLYECREKR